MSIKILLLEDDHELGSLIKEELEGRGYEMQWARDLQQISTLNRSVDLAILDLFLPDGKGFEVVPDLSCPIIMMSALSDAQNRLRGAELGVVDFIPKPFLIDELVIKLERILNSKIQKSRLWIGGAVELDLNKKTITVDGEVQWLNKRDARLLEILTQRYPSVVSRDEIIDFVYGKEQNPSHRTVDNAVVGIRQMLRDEDNQWIRSVRGQGYQWMKEGE
ncbi:MAG: response regulator transcription factor [Bdellovibrionales bacterium]|nr:response regulator transcription factor [Bdellovibrionales bacterium]